MTTTGRTHLTTRLPLTGSSTTTPSLFFTDIFSTDTDGLDSCDAPDKSSLGLHEGV